MGADEVGTLATLKAHRAVTDPISQINGGRIVGAAGDGLLLEFPSVVAAVECAVEIQAVMAERNADIPDDRKMLYRIGINLGDVLVDGDDIYGDGVNVAARLEGLAEPGGVCISEKVQAEVRGKLDVKFTDGGAQVVKNISNPIRVWHWSPGQVEASDLASRPLAGEPLALPDKPSIAVLPFDNMSDDPEQEYFADGLAEDIITSLSKVSSLFVIARNSTFAYKGKAVDIRTVADELGVRYVLEGSVRKGGARLRITAQLIDAGDGSHLWAERYDRTVEDIFDIQDEITQEITTTLQVRLTEGEQVRLRRRQTANLAAWDLYVRARTSLLRFAFEENIMAREQATRALELDPEFSAPWALLAWTYLTDARVGWSGSAAASLEQGAEAALKALEIDETEADAHAMLCAIRAQQQRWKEAEQAGRRAIALSPSSADHYVFYAVLLNFTGRAEEAQNLIRKAMRLSPFYPDMYLGILAISYRLLGRFEEAIAADKERLVRNPENAFSDLRMVASYIELGRDEEARFHVREALRKNPQNTLARVREIDPYQDEGEMSRYLEALRNAGLPE